MSERFTLFRSDRLRWEEEARRLRCPRYNPCPICFKCMAKASHLFVKCQNCAVPLCHHTETEREAMIRRENFSNRLDRFVR